MTVKRSDILPIALILLAAGVYIGGTALYEQRATAFQAEELQLNRSADDITFAASADITHAKISFTTAGERDPQQSWRSSEEQVYINDKRIAEVAETGETVTERLPEHVLQHENTLSAELQIVNSLELEDVRIYTPTHADQAVLWLTYLLTAALLLYGAYRGGEQIAQRYGEEETYDTYVRQSAVFLGIVAVTGAVTLGSQFVAFGALDRPLAQPILHHTAEETQQIFKSETDAMYTRDRAVACDKMFNVSDCNVSTMEAALTEQQVTSYRDIRMYFQKAAVVAMLQRVKRLKDEPFQSTSITEAPARTLTMAFQYARMSVLTAWTQRYTEDVATACRNNSIGPERCFNITTSVLNEHNAAAKQQPYPDICPATYLTEQLNIFQTRPLSDDPVLATFQHTVYIKSISSSDPAQRGIPCSTIQAMPSTPIREVLAMVETMTSAAIYTADITTQTQKQTERLENTTLEAIRDE